MHRRSCIVHTLEVESVLKGLSLIMYSLVLVCMAYSTQTSTYSTDRLQHITCTGDCHRPLVMTWLSCLGGVAFMHLQKHPPTCNSIPLKQPLSVHSYTVHGNATERKIPRADILQAIGAGEMKVWPVRLYLLSERGIRSTER